MFKKRCVIFKTRRQAAGLLASQRKYLKVLLLYASSHPESCSYRARNKTNKHKIGKKEKSNQPAEQMEK